MPAFKTSQHSVSYLSVDSPMKNNSASLIACDRPNGPVGSSRAELRPKHRAKLAAGCGRIMLMFIPFAADDRIRVHSSME